MTFKERLQEAYLAIVSHDGGIVEHATERVNEVLDTEEWGMEETALSTWLTTMAMGFFIARGWTLEPATVEDVLSHMIGREVAPKLVQEAVEALPNVVH